MAPRIGLYYPFIHFQDDRWVKLAALYWGRMGRIVPPGYATHDSPVVKALGESFVLDLSPTGAAGALTDRFARVLTAHAEKLRATYGVDQAHAWTPDPVTAQQMGRAHVPQEGVDAAFAYLHTGKIRPQVRDQLVDEGLAVPTRGGDPSWIGVHRSVARIYMTALADEMASVPGGTGRGLCPVTDDALDHVAVSGWTIERLSAALLEEPSIAGSQARERELDLGLAFVAIESVVPKDLASVPVERIIEVREKYRDELVRFITSIESIGNDLASLSGAEDLQLVKAQLEVAYEERVKPQLHALRHDLRLFKIETVAGAANIKVAAPPALASLASMTGGGVSPVLAVGSGIALGVAGLISGQHLRARQLKRSSPATYLLEVEAGLKPTTLLRRIGQRLSRFVSGA